MKELLNNIRKEDIQSIYECLTQAIGDDTQEAKAYLDIPIGVSVPYLKWDLYYRNLIKKFKKSNIKYSATKKGTWTIFLLYDENSKLLFSFMRERRFNTIRGKRRNKRPQYIQSLLCLNSELQAEEKQVRFLKEDSKFSQEELEKALNDLCVNFESEVDTKKSHHVLVVFSDKYGIINSLKAYLLDSDLDIVCEQDWLDMTKPLISTMPDIVQSEEKESTPALKPKALERIKKRELVNIKEQEIKENA